MHDEGRLAVHSTGVTVEAKHRYHQPLPEWNGRHFWIVTGCWSVREPARSEFDLDVENLLTIDGPGCLHCEQLWSPTMGARCPGDPGERQATSA